MAYIQEEIENAVRGYGHNQMRNVPLRLRPIVCSFAETQICEYPRTLSGSGLALRGVSSTDRSERARADAPDDNEPDPFADWHGVEPMQFPEDCNHPEARMWYSRGRTDKMLEMHEAIMPMVEKVIEKASKC
jgi:hypothetical protein